jgi:hypothetical protein
VTEPHRADRHFAEDDVHVHRVWRKASRWAARAATGAMVLPVVLMMIAVPLEKVLPYGEHLLMGALWAWLVGWLGAPVLGVLSLLLAIRKRLPVTKVEVEEGRLRIEGDGHEMSVGREEMTGAIVVAEDEAAEVEVALTSGNTICVRPGEVGRADALVEALGFGAADRRVVVPLGGPREPLSAGCGAVLVGLGAGVLATCGGAAVSSAASPFGDFLGYFVGAVFVGVTLLVARALTPRRLVIGKDGVLFEGPFRKRFYPRASIFGVARIRQHLALLIGRGDDVREVQLTAESTERQMALLRRIRAALDLPANGDKDPRAEMLARGGETIEKWRERLRRLAAPEKGYRGESVPAETLMHTAADADASAEVRVGAALAIGLGGDQAAKEELRRSIEALASDKLRVALEAAAGGDADEEALAAAVEEEARAEQEDRSKRAALPGADEVEGDRPPRRSGRRSRRA